MSELITSQQALELWGLGKSEAQFLMREYKYKKIRQLFEAVGITPRFENHSIQLYDESEVHDAEAKAEDLYKKAKKRVEDRKAKKKGPAPQAKATVSMVEGLGSLVEKLEQRIKVLESEVLELKHDTHDLGNEYNSLYSILDKKTSPERSA